MRYLITRNFTRSMDLIQTISLSKEEIIELGLDPDNWKDYTMADVNDFWEKIVDQTDEDFVDSNEESYEYFIEKEF